MSDQTKERPDTVTQEDLCNEELMVQCECDNHHNIKYTAMDDDGHYVCPTCQTHWLSELIKIYKGVISGLLKSGGNINTVNDVIKTKVADQHACKVSELEEFGYDFEPYLITQEIEDDQANKTADETVAVSVSGRRTGRTTRIIDSVVQMLFNGQEVAVEDHRVTTRVQKSYLLKRILRRMQSEHNLKKKDFLIRERIPGSITIKLKRKS